jgi:hypothetical protein
LYWLRTSTFTNSKAAGKMKSISTQVLTATLQYEEGQDEYLEKPLEAFKIEMAEENLSGIQAITQPLKSFNGIPTEKLNEFYVRVSERLKHKQRAITPWDYEHLVLEKSPQIYKFIKLLVCLRNW